jgi:hypothetical protein
MPDWPGVGHTTPGRFCTRWWPARRTRSDAPHRAGRAAGPFDFMAHVGVRGVRVESLFSCVFSGGNLLKFPREDPIHRGHRGQSRPAGRA